MGCVGSRGQAKKCQSILAKNGEPPRQRRSTVHIYISESIPRDTEIKNVVFVGGPKSGKGEVIEELVESFGVKVVCAESLIIASLSKKLGNIGNKNGEGKTDTASLLHHLRSNPGTISLDWVLDLIKTEILKYPDSVHVIDLLPNSKVIFRDQSLFKNAAELLQKFEEACPVAFAMHLYIDKENLNRQLDTAKHLSTPEGCTAEGGISDEVNLEVTKKRHAFFEEALIPVRNYFKESDRLIEVDVSSMSKEKIWFKIVTMFASFNMSERQNNNLIVIFVKDPEMVRALIECQIRLIRVADIVDEPGSDYSLLLECLAFQISELGCPNICYIVDVTGSSLGTPEMLTESAKCLIYELKEPAKLSSHLNKYQNQILEDMDKPECKNWDENEFNGFKAPNNLTLLFSQDFDAKSSEVIATTYCSMEK